MICEQPGHFTHKPSGTRLAFAAVAIGLRAFLNQAIGGAYQTHVGLRPPPRLVACGAPSPSSSLSWARCARRGHATEAADSCSNRMTVSPRSGLSGSAVRSSEFLDRRFESVSDDRTGLRPWRP